MNKKVVWLLMCVMLLTAFTSVFSIESSSATGNTIYGHAWNFYWNGTEFYCLKQRLEQNGLSIHTVGQFEWECGSGAMLDLVQSGNTFTVSEEGYAGNPVRNQAQYLYMTGELTESSAAFTLQVFDELKKSIAIVKGTWFSSGWGATIYDVDYVTPLDFTGEIIWGEILYYDYEIKGTFSGNYSYDDGEYFGSSTWTGEFRIEGSMWEVEEEEEEEGADSTSAGDSASRYYIDLGEYWPDLEGYIFSCSIPEGYEVSNVTFLYNGTITLELSGPPVFEIFDSQKVMDTPADYLSIDISWVTLEGDFIFEGMLEYSCGGPSPYLIKMSNRKTSGYDDYYLKSIGCYYCPEPEIEGLFFEASIPGVIFLNESLKYPALEYCLGYSSAFSCYLGEVNPDQYFTIGETPLNEKKSEVVNHIFSSIQITPSKETDKKGEMPVTEIVIVTSAAAGVAVLLGVLTTEWGKYKFLSFLPLLGPLYLRTVREEVFDNQKRLCMYNHIAENQPVVYAEIKKTCNLSDGEINWHARMMIQLDLIKTERKGFHLFFILAKSPRLPPGEFIRLTDLQRSVLALIVKKPGITQAEIVEKIGLKQQNISYNLLKLEEKGKIRVEKKGTVKFYYPIKKDSSSI